MLFILFSYNIQNEDFYENEELYDPLGLPEIDEPSDDDVISSDDEDLSDDDDDDDEKREEKKEAKQEKKEAKLKEAPKV